MKRFIAITTDGKEYLYKLKTAHRYPVSKEKIVLDILNRSRYMLQDGEKWFAYYSGGGEVYADCQSFGFRRGQLKRFITP